jgi:hypothetical protein
MSLESIFALCVIAALLGSAVACLAFALPAHTRAVNAERLIVEVEMEIRNERTAREALAIQNAAAETLAGRVPHLELTISNLRSQIESSNIAVTEARANL